MHAGIRVLGARLGRIPESRARICSGARKQKRKLGSRGGGACGPVLNILPKLPSQALVHGRDVAAARNFPVPLRGAAGETGDHQPHCETETCPLVSQPPPPSVLYAPGTL